MRAGPACGATRPWLSLSLLVTACARPMTCSLMTYSLNTLQRAAPRRSRCGRARCVSPTKSRWSLGLVALVFWLLALVSYSAPDAALSTSGTGGDDHATGAAAWAPGWPMPAISCSAFRSGGASPRPARLAVVAGALDARRDRRASRRTMRIFRARAWPSGSAWPCCCAPARCSNGRACTASKPRLPDHAGGVLGYLVGPAGREVDGLHRLGTGVRGAGGARRGRRVPLLVGPGRRAHRRARSTGWSTSRREKREIAQDLAFGKQAARAARGDPARASASRSRSTIPTPVLIEPAAGRGAQERARRQGTAEAAVPRTARLASCRRSICSMARRRGRKPSRPKRWR